MGGQLSDLLDLGTEALGKAVVLFFIWPMLLLGLAVKAVRRLANEEPHP